MDQIANMLTSIRNGYLAKKEFVEVPYSKIKAALAEKLEQLSYVQKVQADEKQRTLKIFLSYTDGQPALRGIERVSKPSLRIYTDVKNTPRVLSGLGDTILSTSKGIVSGREARKKKLGGELILKVW